LRIYNNYILTIAVLLLITTIILIATEQNSLDVFYSVYVIEALIVTELYVYFNKKSRRGLNFVGTVLFGGFAIVLCLQVFKAFI
jgi:RsiW-degrading membrane proteinase PrsW (M82 family)